MICQYFNKLNTLCYLQETPLTWKLYTNFPDSDCLHLLCANPPSASSHSMDKKHSTQNWRYETKSANRVARSGVEFRARALQLPKQLSGLNFGVAEN